MGTTLFFLLAGAPNPVLTPAGSTTHAVNITCGNIQEVDPSGNIVRSLDMSTMPWFISDVSCFSLSVVVLTISSS